MLIDLDGLHKRNLDVQSFLLLINDYKPVIRLSFSEHNYKYLSDLCKNNKLILVNKKCSKVFGDNTFKGSLAYISKIKKNSIRAYKAEQQHDVELFGSLLGYPECCVKSFYNNMENCIELLSNNKKEEIFFQCNTIFHFESKLQPGNNVEIYQKNYESIFSKCQQYFLIKHMPCDLCCEESKKIGNITLKLLKSEFPDFANEIVSVIKRPVLYFDYFNWLVLRGKVKNNKEIIYTNVVSIKSLFPDKYINIIKQGNKIIILGNVINVFFGQKKIGTIKTNKQGILLNFK